MAMEKNGVLGPKNMNKTASRGCPTCGSVLDYAASLPRCPIHGTAPFEFSSYVGDTIERYKNKR